MDKRVASDRNAREARDQFRYKDSDARGHRMARRRNLGIKHARNDQAEGHHKGSKGAAMQYQSKAGVVKYAVVAKLTRVVIGPPTTQVRQLTECRQ